MRVPIAVVRERRGRLERLLRENRYLDVHELCARLRVSAATARRDLAALEKNKLITRTRGGALADFNLRFPSFRERQHQAAAAKRRIAARAVEFIKPGMTVFLDAGTTVYALAQLLVARRVGPLTAVTASIPAADLLAQTDNIKVVLAGGEFLGRQSVLAGRTTQQALGEFSYDLAFLSAEGANERGLWNSQADVVKSQQVVLRRAGRACVCLDSGKLGKTAPHFLAPWSAKLLLVTEKKVQRGDAEIANFFSGCRKKKFAYDGTLSLGV